MTPVGLGPGTASAVAEAGTTGSPAPACGTGEGHGTGVSPPLLVALLALFAGYGVVVALVAHGAESVWGAWAAGGYGAAALVAPWCARRLRGAPLVVALAGAVAVPAAVLPINWGATSEVRVVARATSLWLAHGTPYLAPDRLLSWRSYDPYLPGMSLFGLPRAFGLPGPLGDPLTWMAGATVVLLALACRIAGSELRCRGCDRGALLQTLLLVATPIFAFPMALGVTDPPVIALMCLGLALAARRPPTGQVTVPITFHGVLAPRPGRTLRARLALTPARSTLLAGVTIGVACALKATAWPALPVVLALVAARDGRRAAVRFAGGALGTMAALIAATAPALLSRPKAFWQNIVAYPLGISHRPTPAASPLPGHLLAGMGSTGHLAAIGLLGLAGLAVGASLVLRPPRHVQQAALRLAIGLAALFLLAPASRFGYFSYPLGVLGWLAVTATDRRPVRGAPPGTPRAGAYRPVL